MEIRGSIALVTGAARGIGRATAVALADAGAGGVALVDLSEDALAETVAAVEAGGAKPLPLALDVGEPSALRAMFEAVEAEFGRLDVLHNNAGIGEGPGDWPALRPERAARIVDVNLRAVILGTQLALPLMQRGGGGVVVATASGAAFTPLPPQAVYAATKAGIVHFTRSCVPLHASHGVRVNCVCPGLVDTPMLLDTGEGRIADWLQPICDAVTLLRPEDIAKAVLEIVRDDAVVGEAVVVGN